jgi:hypothetical protein
VWIACFSSHLIKTEDGVSLSLSLLILPYNVLFSLSEILFISLYIM